ncbi:MAG: protein kinase [Polyangiales bacterium]
MVQARDSSDRALGVSPGEVIGGRYEVLRLLGVGGTGAVFEARHQAIGRTVALKVLLPELAASAMVPRRFLQEAQTANQVRHRNIVEVLDFGDDHGRLYMVMELLHGEGLAAFLRREAPVAPGTLVRVLDPVMAALIYAHERGIIHRDVKPQNIFLSQTPGEDEPTPKLIDFGIAKRIVADDVALTATGMILGTPAYMAPEQALGSKDVTPAADQYSVAAILFEGLTGRVPHQADTYPAMLVAIVSQPPADLRALRPDLDPALATTVMRALNFDPAKRYESLAAFREALRAFRHLDQRGRVVVPAAAPPGSSITRPDGSREPSAPVPLSPASTTAAPPDPATLVKAPRPDAFSDAPTTSYSRPDPRCAAAAVVVVLPRSGWSAPPWPSRSVPRDRR